MPEKRLSFLFISPLLTFSLGLWILSTALAQTIGHPAQTKTLIHQSGLYHAVIPSQVAQAAKSNPSLASLPLDNPKIQEVLNKSLDSSKVQSEGDQAVDGIYTWLEGKSTQPKIAIDVTPDAASLTDAVTKYAQSLPPCAPGQSPGTDVATIPLSATCLPAGVSAETVRSFVAAQIAANPGLLQTPKLTQDDVTLPNGKTIMAGFASAPQWYHWAQLVPFISAIIAALCLLLLPIILKPVGGLRSAGKHLLSVGLTLAIIAWLLAWAIGISLDSFLPKSNDPNVGAAINKLINLFDQSYRDHVVHLGAYTAAAGLVLFLTAVVLRFALKHRPHGDRKPAARPAAPAPVSLSGNTANASFTPLQASSAPPLPKKASARKSTGHKKPAARKATSSHKKTAVKKPRSKKSAE